MKPIHEHEINTGKIFTRLYLRRVFEDELFNKPFVFRVITQHLQNILKAKNILYKSWEALTTEERDNYRRHEGKEEYGTWFLIHRSHSFDVGHYNLDCVLTYKEDSYNNVFRFFFALKITFTSIAKMNDFLNYQCKENFEGDTGKFLEFLDEALLEHHDLIDGGKREKVMRYLTAQGKQEKTEKVVYGLDFRTPIKEYSPKELRGLYNLSDKQFRSFVKEHVNEIGKLGKSRKYSPKQVYKIFYFLGDPADGEKK